MGFWKCKMCHFYTSIGSEFWFLWIFPTFLRLKLTKWTKCTALKMANMAVFALLDSSKLISRKIWVIQNPEKFHHHFSGSKCPAGKRHFTYIRHHWRTPKCPTAGPRKWPRKCTAAAATVTKHNADPRSNSLPTNYHTNSTIKKFICFFDHQ